MLSEWFFCKGWSQLKGFSWVLQYLNYIKITLLSLMVNVLENSHGHPEVGIFHINSIYHITDIAWDR